MIPQDPGTPGEASPIEDDVVGVMTNGVLLDSHAQTWNYDTCNGHSDRNNQYHYHIPPICYLKSMGVPAPESDKWWIDEATSEVRLYADMHKQFPAKGSSPVVGFARDGFPIYALYGPEADSPLVRSKLYGGDLDECNGMGEGEDYAYYITAEPPFVPECLRGTIGTIAYSKTDKQCPAGGIVNVIEGVKAVEADKTEVPVAPTPEPPSPTPDSPGATFAETPMLGALVSVVALMAFL